VYAEARVRPEIKFCGMTRSEDIVAAGELGAQYVGFIFAGGPRAVTPVRARGLKAHVPSGLKCVGVFGPGRDLGAPAGVARSVGLDVVQLHGDPDESLVEEVRRGFGGAVWAALRLDGAALPKRAAALFASADAVVLDSYSTAALGGTGVALPWDELASAVDAVRSRARLVLAGGLRAETVGSAMRALGPDVVDVSSGVESAPGIKDPAKLKAFRDAVWAEGRNS
jgi:phosphoribosylanthranilate isomerase